MRFSDAVHRLKVLQRILLQPKSSLQSFSHLQNALRLSSGTFILIIAFNYKIFIILGFMKHINLFISKKQL